MNYLNYLRYILRHKFYVMIAARYVKLPFWQALTHDLSKFSWSEWKAYMDCFYTGDGNKQYRESSEFKHAWNSHQKRNKHHYQYWLLTYDDGRTEALCMPVKYVREMVADWMGAGRAITGKWDTKTWYRANKDKMNLHPFTRAMAEMLLDVEDEDGD